MGRGCGHDLMVLLRAYLPEEDSQVAPSRRIIAQGWVAPRPRYAAALPLISVFFGSVIHRELESNWEKMKAGQPLEHVRPLE